MTQLGDFAMKNHINSALLIGLGLVNLGIANADALTGNRYGYPVLYHSEISSAKAWLSRVQRSLYTSDCSGSRGSPAAAAGGSS